MTINPVMYVWVSELVRKETGNVLPPGKEYLVQARLQPLATAAGLGDTNSFVRRAQRPEGVAERRAIVEALTINETSWFRDAAVFDTFRRQLLPALLAARPAWQPIRVWSAAASSGQEAYSLAMVLTEELGERRRFEIFGTDVARGVLEQARRGRYTQMEMGRGLPPAYLARHFQRDGGGWQVNPALRGNIRFRELNLAAPLPAGLPTFDVVFLRNVLIYFDTATKTEVLERVRTVMAPDGWLLLGTAETTRGLGDGFRVVRMNGMTIYQAARGPSASALRSALPSAAPSPLPSTVPSSLRSVGQVARTVER